jgi:hypothetical protein
MHALLHGVILRENQALMLSVGVVPRGRDVLFCMIGSQLFLQPRLLQCTFVECIHCLTLSSASRNILQRAGL